MTCVLEYGIDARVDLDLSAETLLAVCAEPVGQPLDDLPAAVELALAEPMNYPSLALATVPDDQIVLALEHGVPQASALVAAVASYLVERGTAADHIAVLSTPESLAAGEHDPRELLPDAWRGEVKVEVHAPETTGSLSLLGASHEGKPIYLNRTMLDADLVVPIGCLRNEPTIGYHGQYGGLFPSFADAKTRERYQKLSGPKTSRQRAAKEREEIDEIGWLLGTQFTVQALPGGADRLLNVLAGEIPEVFRNGQAAYSSAWRCSVPRRASLVVASVSGGAAQQTWENLARALSAASRVAAEGGAIALCTDIAVEPGDAVRSLSQSDDLSLALRRIARGAMPDALIAAQLAQALEQGKVYLLSQLDESLVDELGLAPIGEPGDLARLARKHESCIVLANAQYAIPTPEAE
jgi:nickel-dependent lactate racemase